MKNPRLSEVSVDLGLSRINIPVFTHKNESSPFSVLITAGVDGDEYASIDAAYALIEKFSDNPPKINLTIIPVVNILGFELKVSHNPLDGKLPKFIFPGRISGSATDRLMAWVSDFVYSSGLWLDLHGGALDEHLNPFIAVPFPKNAFLRKLTDGIINTLDGKMLIYDKDNKWTYHDLNKKNILRVVIESGYGGLRKDPMRNFHLDIVEKILKVYTRDSSKPSKLKSEKTHFSKIIEIGTKNSGLWYPRLSDLNTIKKNQFIGKVVSQKNILLEEIKSPAEGKILWYKTGLHCKRGDTLLGIAV